jgi:glycosyltransferase involved in cell wall biosynthesis
MTTPAVSVLMPVYNAEHYVAEAVRSVLDQSFTDFEFLILDDGSTDGSLRILQEYAARDPRIRVIARPNTGIVGALNDLLAEARGELIARMDADDICRPDRFARQVALLRDHPEIVAVGGAIQEIDERGRILTDFPAVFGDAVIQDQLLAGRNVFAHSAMMLRREAMEQVGRYRPEMQHAEDLDLWLRLGEVGQLENLPEVVLQVRVHPLSVSSRNAARQHEVAKLAADQACDRRGLPRRYETQTPYRPVGGRTMRFQFAVKYGWWAFLRGDRPLALEFGAKALRLRPWHPEGWRLLVCSLIKPMRSK